MFARTSITVDPAWPWSLPAIGVSGLLIAGLLLAALTVWTYLGVRQATPRRILGVLLLRLAALLIAVAVVLRPSLAHEDDDAGMLPSKLYVVVDDSDSMNVTDSFNNLSRFENAKRLLTAPDIAELLKRLGPERKIEVVYLMGAEDVRPLDLNLKPSGKRTDIGFWLHELWQQHGKEPNLRGLVLLTDGADNGSRFAALEEAAKFRGAWPIHAFALGETTTTAAHKDIAVAQVTVLPVDRVQANQKMTVKATLAAPGFDDAVLQASLWIEEPGGKMKQVGPSQSVNLSRRPDKTVVFTPEAPDVQGEVKVSVKVEPFPGETNVTNNEGSTFANVTKEGVNILWVEGKLRYESALAIRTALSKDQRFHVTYAVKLQQAKPEAAAGDFFNLDKRHYDVIVIGDISAQRFAEGQPGVFDKVREMVIQKGTGLVMLAGYSTFGAGDWQNSKLAPLLPSRFSKEPQIESKVKVRPEPAGEQFLLKLSLDPAKNAKLWNEILEPLDGMTPLGEVDSAATPYAFGVTDTGKFPIMASIDRGKGRVLVFGGDTTYRAWRRSPEAVTAYELFWSQMMLWLARQEHSKGNLWVRPDTRRLDLGQNDRLGFTVNFTKGAGKVVNPTFQAKVIGPDKSETPVTILEENQEYRGYFSRPPAPGQYQIVVAGNGVDEKNEQMEGKHSARFMVYDEDRESLRPAADHQLLQKIAQAAGEPSSFAIAEDRKLVDFLTKLPPLEDPDRAASSRWPDWRRSPVSDSAGAQLAALWQSSALLCFLAFTALLCTEWFLRRRWGMV
jgi:uncharacterized membrane protein